MLPLTHAGTATQASAVAFHAKAGVLQAQLDWPVSALAVLYSSVVPHVRQVASPASENWPAAQLAQMAFVVELQADA